MMNSFKRNLKALAGFVLMAFILVSCAPSSLDETLEEKMLAGVQAAQQLPDCVAQNLQIGDEVPFLLIDNTTNADYDPPSNFHLINYAYMGVSIPFTIGDDCTCNVKRYDLEFEDFPTTPGDFIIQDEDGQNIDFDTELVDDNGYQTTVVTIDYDDITTDIFLNVNDNVHPAPELVTAGGLCVIENVSNPMSGTEYTGLMFPYTEIIRDYNGNVERERYHIPVQNLHNLKAAKLYTKLKQKK